MNLLKILFQKLFREPFSPDLINLVRYEKDLLYYKRHGQILMPPPTRGYAMGKVWTESEEQAMDDNYKAAKEIYEAIKNGD